MEEIAQSNREPFSCADSNSARKAGKGHDYRPTSISKLGETWKLLLEEASKPDGWSCAARWRKTRWTTIPKCCEKGRIPPLPSEWSCKLRVKSGIIYSHNSEHWVVILWVAEEEVTLLTATEIDAAVDRVRTEARKAPGRDGIPNSVWTIVHRANPGILDSCGLWKASKIYINMQNIFPFWHLNFDFELSSSFGIAFSTTTPPVVASNKN